MSLEQPPASTPKELREYLVRQIDRIGRIADYIVGGLAIMTIKKLTIVGANDATTGGGQLYLNGVTGNRIDFNTNGSGAPTFTTRSVGTKLVLYPLVGAAAVDYGLGIETSNLWFSTSTTSTGFKWYGGTTLAATLTGAGALSLSSTLNVTGIITNTGGITGVGGIKSSSSANGIGYTTGAGGTVTQITSKATGVTLSKMCGTITTHTASLAANTAVSFVLTNTVLAATDNIILNIVGGTNGAYCLGLDAVAAGSCTITLRNLTAGPIAEAVTIRFTILNSVNA